MFTKSVDPLFYFAGTIFVSGSIGFMTTLAGGCLAFGIFCILASFLK